MTTTLDSVSVDQLDDNQRAAAHNKASRLCIVASAGSGKTRVIVKRIEHLCRQGVLLPSQIVAITFTRKAGFELAQRLNRLFPPSERDRPIVGTLHSFALNELNSFHNENRTTMRTLVENSTAILTALKIGRAHKVARAISWCKTRMMSPDDITEDNIGTIRRQCHIASTTLSAQNLIDAWNTYHKHCASKRIMDHDDILIEYCQRLGDNIYRASRQFLYRHIFVDEFQDTTPLHMEIYRRLAGENTSITVVGDPDQSIFSFAGSSDVFLNNFSDYFPGAHNVFLSTNYRSTRANVEVARSILPHRDISAVRATTIVPQIHAYSDHETEAKGVMEIISRSHARGTPMNEIAVLVRTNDQKQAFVKAATALGIPFHRGRHVVTDPVAREVLSIISSLRKKRKWKSIYDALDDIDGAQIIAGELDEEHKNLFSDLRKSAREYMEMFPYDRQGDVSGYFEFIESQLASERDSRGGFSLLTFHQAKGLEFTCVIIAGFEQGLVPLYTDKARKQEETRLAYVALSRAADEMHITRASVRVRHEVPVVQKPSEFLPNIEQHISEIDVENDVISQPEALKRIADIRAKYLIKKRDEKS
jgi:DNA helicase-2/ATP-dependent DNA helicase PcrA